MIERDYPSNPRSGRAVAVAQARYAAEMRYRSLVAALLPAAAILVVAAAVLKGLPLA
jgi:hypothetical protein